MARELLSLKLIPMRSPEASLNTLPIQASENINLENPSLLIVPGEASELVVNLENLGTYTLELTLEITGDFPRNWYTIITEVEEENSAFLLTPGETIKAIIRFQTPADFFENPFALGVGQVLKLDYQSRLAVYGAAQGTGSQLLEIATFNLYVRPVSRYQQFLPNFYREIDFVGRFLQIFEATLEPDVQILSNLWAYLDPLTAPIGMLEFLAHWVGWKNQPYLTLEQQRNLIRNAIEIYRWRGTRRGLRLYLYLATRLPLDDHIMNEDEKHIGIYEFFNSGFVLDKTRLGYDAILGGVRPFHFTVRLRPEPDRPIEEALVRTIIEQEKPAFCSYELIIETG
jgi:phage tail protein domain